MQALLEPSSWLHFLIDASIKGTILLAGTGLVCLGLRRASAAARHLLWSLALGSLVLLPALTLLLPAWRVSFFPQMPEIASAAPAAQTISIQVSGSGEETTTLLPPIRIQLDPEMGTQVGLMSSASAPGQPVAWISWALPLWVLGLLVVLGQQAVGMLRVRKLASRAQRLTQHSWTELLSGLCRRLGLQRRVVLLQGTDHSVPMTWGTLKPVVLLPAEAARWGEERRRLVLLHELGHILRRDTLTQGLAQAACALYWFHPLVWVAARSLRSEREKACDDLVLSVGAKASDYAGHLLDIARTVGGSCCSSFATVAMARRSQLEGRLLAILDPNLSRFGLRKSFVALCVLLLGSVLLPLASLRPLAQAEESLVAEEPVGIVEATAVVAEKTTPPKASAEPTKSSLNAMDVLVDIVEQDPDMDVKLEAIESMRHLPGSFEPLERLLRTNRDPDVRQHIIDALRHDPDCQKVTALFLKVAEEDPDEDVQQEAVEKLRYFPGGFDHLVRLARSHKNPNVRRAAVSALKYEPGSDSDAENCGSAPKP